MTDHLMNKGRNLMTTLMKPLMNTLMTTLMNNPYEHGHKDLMKTLMNSLTSKTIWFHKVLMTRLMTTLRLTDERELYAQDLVLIKFLTSVVVCGGVNNSYTLL
jgi:hypothetical protein